MPKRTNEFQKLIYWIKQHVADGAIVEESKMLPDLLTGTPREVDIWIERVVAGHKVTIGVECTAQKKAAGVGWVDKMWGTHRSLPTGKLVLVSKHGFSGEAVAKAEKYNVELISLGGLNANKVKRLFGGSSSIWFKLFNIVAEKVVIRVAASGGLDAETFRPSPDNDIYDHTGNRIGTAKELVYALLHNNYSVPLFGAQGEDDHKWFELVADPFKDTAGNSLYMQKIDPPVLRPIEWVRISGPCNFNTSEFKLRHGQLKDISIAWGTGTLKGKKMLLVASSDEKAGQKATVTPYPQPKKSIPT